MTTQANHKHSMRTVEEEMLNAENRSSLAWLDGAKYPADELTEDWKKVLFNQFHDLAAGSGIADIYKDAQKDYAWVRMSTNEISAGALEAVSDHIDTANGSKGAETQSVVVFNPRMEQGRRSQGSRFITMVLARNLVALKGPSDEDIIAAIIASYDPQTGIAELAIPLKNVPPLGYEVLLLGTSKSMFGVGTGGSIGAVFGTATGHNNANAKPISDGSEQTGSGDKSNLAKPNTVGESSWDRSRSATSCCASASTGHRAVLSVLSTRSPVQSHWHQKPAGNQLQLFKDTPGAITTLGILTPGTLDAPPSTIEKADSVESVTSSDGSEAIRVTRSWQSSKFVQTIRLDLPRHRRHRQ